MSPIKNVIFIPVFWLIQIIAAILIYDSFIIFKHLLCMSTNASAHLNRLPKMFLSNLIQLLFDFFKIRI